MCKFLSQYSNIAEINSKLQPFLNPKCWISDTGSATVKNIANETVELNGEIHITDGSNHRFIPIHLTWYDLQGYRPLVYAGGDCSAMLIYNSSTKTISLSNVKLFGRDATGDLQGFRYH